MENPKTIIFGASGFLGSNFVETLTKLERDYLAVTSSPDGPSSYLHFNPQEHEVGILEEAISRFKPNQLLFLAAYKDDHLFISAPEDAYEKHFAINFEYYRLAARAIIATPLSYFERSLLYVSSSKLTYGEPGTSLYSATKAASCALTKTISKEYARFGVRANNLHLGYFGGPLWDKIPQKKRDILANEPALKRLGRRKDFNHFALAVLDNSYLTGQDLRLDGGLIG